MGFDDVLVAGMTEQEEQEIELQALIQNEAARLLRRWPHNDAEECGFCHVRGEGVPHKDGCTEKWLRGIAMVGKES